MHTPCRVYRSLPGINSTRNYSRPDGESRQILTPALGRAAASFFLFFSDLSDYLLYPAALQQCNTGFTFHDNKPRPEWRTKLILSDKFHSLSKQRWLFLRVMLQVNKIYQHKALIFHYLNFFL